MAHETEFPHETIPMNDPKRRFFSGDTLQQAVIQRGQDRLLDLIRERVGAAPPMDAPLVAGLSARGAP